MDLQEALALAARPMGRGEAAALMGFLVGEETADAEVAELLTALARRPATGAELAGYCDTLRARMVPAQLGDGLVDTCGTGGGKPTPNVSTVAALIAAAAGAKVAKHGNRAVTSAVGSADVLEALGVKASASAGAKRRMLDVAGVCFLFAPDHHPALKKVGPVRRSLGFRTVFNQLGPLLNPAGARRQVTGVYDQALLEPTAEALALLGAEQAVVVWNDAGYDEALPFGTTHARLVGPEAGPAELSAADFGAEELDPASVPSAEDAEAAAGLARQALRDRSSASCRLCLPTAGLTLWAAGLARSAAEGHALAALAVEEGKAYQVLEDIVRLSHDT